MGCLSVILSRTGQGSTVTFSREGDGLAVGLSRQGGMSVRFALVCSVGAVEGFLYASDALLLTVSGGRLIVQQV